MNNRENLCSEIVVRDNLKILNTRQKGVWCPSHPLATYSAAGNVAGTGYGAWLSHLDTRN